MLNLDPDQPAKQEVRKGRERADLTRLTPAEAVRRMARLEEEMHIAADALEFERAADLRDEVAEIRAMLEHGSRQAAGAKAN